MFLLTHTLPLSNSYILYTRTLITLPTQKKKIYGYVYTHTHICKHTVPFTTLPLRLRLIINLPPLRFQLLSMSFEVLRVSLSLLSFCPYSSTSLFPFPSVSLSCSLDFYSLLIQFCFLTPTLCDTRLSS